MKGVCAQLWTILLLKQANKYEILLQNMLPLLLEYPKTFEILKLAQNIYTTKHGNVIKIYIYTYI